MNAAEHQRAAGHEGLQCGRYDLTRRGKDDGRIQHDRRIGKRITDPGCAELFGQGLMALTVARRNINIRASAAGDLDTDMARGTKAVDAQIRALPPGDTSQPQRTKAYDPCTQQRCRLNIGKADGQLIKEGGRSRHVLCVATIPRPARELGLLA